MYNNLVRKAKTEILVDKYFLAGGRLEIPEGGRVCKVYTTAGTDGGGCEPEGIFDGCRGVVRAGRRYTRAADCKRRVGDRRERFNPDVGKLDSYRHRGLSGV